MYLISLLCFMHPSRSKRKTTEVKQRKRIRPCLKICQTVEERCPYLLPGDRSPGYNTQYAGEPTFLCNGECFSIVFFYSLLFLFTLSNFFFCHFLCTFRNIKTHKNLWFIPKMNVVWQHFPFLNCLFSRNFRQLIQIQIFPKLVTNWRNRIMGLIAAVTTTVIRFQRIWVFALIVIHLKWIQPIAPR